jgi:uncharacterized protein (TIGR02271 family)
MHPSKPLERSGPVEEQVIPLADEHAEIATRPVERGRVRLKIWVEEREELAEAALRQEEVRVERVAVGRPVAAPPPVREEDGVLIVPVLEERLVVRTELILKEELRITRQSRTEHVTTPVRLRAERAEVAREDFGSINQPDTQEG